MDISFRIEQTFTPIYSLGGYSVPDKNWLYTDQAGHEHKWEGEKLPTLTYIPPVTEFVYCECCDGYEGEVEPGYYVCSQCEEKIKPGMICKTDPLLYQTFGTRYFVNDVQVTYEQYNEKMSEFYDSQTTN